MKEIQRRFSMRWEGRKAGEMKDPKERDKQIYRYTTKITGNQIPPKQSRKTSILQAMEKKAENPPNPKSSVILPGRRLCGPWIMARWLRSFESQYYSWNLVQHGRSHCHLGRMGGWLGDFPVSDAEGIQCFVFFFEWNIGSSPPIFCSGRSASSKRCSFWTLTTSVCQRSCVFFGEKFGKHKFGPQWGWFFTKGHLLDM